MTVLSNSWTLEGEVVDMDTLFRLRDQIVSYSIAEMMVSGFNPISSDPNDVLIEDKGDRIHFTFIWLKAG